MLAPAVRFHLAPLAAKRRHNAISAKLFQKFLGSHTVVLGGLAKGDSIFVFHGRILPDFLDKSTVFSRGIIDLAGESLNPIQLGPTRMAYGRSKPARKSLAARCLAPSAPAARRSNAMLRGTPASSPNHSPLSAVGNLNPFL